VSSMRGLYELKKAEIWTMTSSRVNFRVFQDHVMARLHLSPLLPIFWHELVQITNSNNNTAAANLVKSS
jgi:hypothetical protein